MSYLRICCAYVYIGYLLKNVQDVSMYTVAITCAVTCVGAKIVYVCSYVHEHVYVYVCECVIFVIYSHVKTNVYV